MRLKGKIAMVTGSSSGIGSAIAKGMAAEGAAVVVNYNQNEAGAKATASAVTDLGQECIAIRGDVGLAKDVKAMFATVKEEFGRLEYGSMVHEALADFLTPEGPGYAALADGDYATPGLFIANLGRKRDVAWHEGASPSGDFATVRINQYRLGDKEASGTVDYSPSRFHFAFRNGASEV